MKTTRNRSKTVWTLAALSAVVLLSFGGAVQAAAVALLNPGFELGPATNSPPTNCATTGTAVAAEKIYDGAPFGNWSMAVKPGGQAVQTTNHIISASDVYTLSFWSAQTNDPNGDVNAIFLADNGGTLTEMSNTGVGIAGGHQNWQPYQAQYSFPGAGFVGQKLAIGFGNVSPGNNWVGVDEVSLDASTGVPPGPGSFSFSEDFNGLTGGTFNGGQFESGLAVAYGGNLPDWSKSGGGVVHVVDQANVYPNIVNPRDFAVMIWQDNVITQASGMAANASGLTYTVSFDAGPAVYQIGSQQTSAADGLLIEVLRGDNSVLASYTHLPGAWDHPGNTPLEAVSFQYTGDGTGDVRLRIGPSNPGSGRFGGAIDNLYLSVQPEGDIPEPATMALLGLAVAGLGGYVRRRRKA